MRVALLLAFVVAPVAAAAASADPSIVHAYARFSGPSTLDVTWTYANLGDAPSAGSHVLVEYFASDAWHPMLTRSVPALDPGEERDMAASACHAPLRTVGALDVRVTVDPHAAQPDADRGNNAAMTTVGEGWPVKAVQTPVTAWC